MKEFKQLLDVVLPALDKLQNDPVVKSLAQAVKEQMTGDFGFSTLRWKKDAAGYSTQVDVPGFSKDEVGVSVENDTVVIEAVSFLGKRQPVKQTLALPSDDVDVTQLDATLENGVLSLVLPLKPRSAHKVTVK